MEKVLTVVVPAYNAEAYLANCLDSLCLPDLQEILEVIVVDDGSADRTGVMADQYQERYPRTVRVIHKGNGGHGSGINCGITAASGRYFKVVDADDWVEADGLRNLIDFLARTVSDAVVTGFYWAYDDGSGHEEQFRRRAELREPFSGVSYGRVYRFDSIAEKIYVKMHGLTLRTSILKEHRIQVDEGCFYVDMEYILYPIPFIETICFMQDFVYQYRIGRSGQSVAPRRMARLQDDYDRVLRSLFDFYTGCMAAPICSQEKCSYIARIIARAVAGRMKIFLSLPYGRASKTALTAFDQMVKRNYPNIYAANENLAVQLLRFSGYHLYPAAFWLLWLINRRR